MDEEALGFPLWPRINHFLNLFCIFLLMRSGVQILADRPKLYWNDDTTPGSEWATFGKKVMPQDRLWTSMDEAEHISSIVALPGGHHNLGAARNWHFLIVTVWIHAGYVVFHAFPQAEYAPDVYYEVLTLEEILDPQTMLAYEMNWRSLPIPHGAPCRLRIEIKTGYKMVKYLRAIEVVDDFVTIGKGHGGYREGHQYYDKVAAI